MPTFDAVTALTRLRTEDGINHPCQMTEKCVSDAERDQDQLVTRDSRRDLGDCSAQTLASQAAAALLPDVQTGRRRACRLQPIRTTEGTFSSASAYHAVWRLPRVASHRAKTWLVNKHVIMVRKAKVTLANRCEMDGIVRAFVSLPCVVSD